MPSKQLDARLRDLEAEVNLQLWVRTALASLPACHRAAAKRAIEDAKGLTVATGDDHARWEAWVDGQMARLAHDPERFWSWRGTTESSSQA